MKKAVITLGGKQHIVTEGQELIVDRIITDKKSFTVEPLMAIDGDKTSVGAPSVKDAKVTVEITDDEVKGEKVLAIRYKSKKRVHKIRGHRQTQNKIVIKKIALV
jgi:large subunit ribosomal protein L21